MDTIMEVAGVVVLAFLAVVAWCALAVGSMAEEMQERAEAIRAEAARRVAEIGERVA